jgi:hypothetical protein
VRVIAAAASSLPTPEEDVAGRASGGSQAKALTMWILIGLGFAVAAISGVSVTMLVPVALAIMLILVFGFRALIGLLGALMLLFKITEEHSSTMWLMALGLAASAAIVLDHNWSHLQPTRSTAQRVEARRPVRGPEHTTSLGAVPAATGESKDQVAAHDLPPIPDFYQPAVREAGIDENPSLAVPMIARDAQKPARGSGELIEPRDPQGTWPVEDNHEATGARGGMRTVALAARSLFFLPVRADDE